MPQDKKEDLSPLQKNNVKQVASKIAIAITVLLLAYAIFKSDNKPKKEKLAAEIVESAADSNTQAPKLTLNAKEQKQLAENIKQLDTQIADNKQITDAEKLERLRETAAPLVYSADTNDAPASSKNKQNPQFANSYDGNSQFMEAASQTQAPTVKARQLKHLSTLLAQGNIIAATLESRIASDLPGMVRAVTSADVYSENNSRLLLPKGSRLIGQYNSGIAQGQNRVFIIWQRLIRPDGIDIQLNSPGTDGLGAAGLAADSIDHHFFQQFGTAALLSIIGAGAANTGVKSSDNLNSSAAYRSAIANSFSESAKTTLQNNGVIKPTLYVNQGQVINVFVAKDLDFHDTLKGDD